MTSETKGRTRAKTMMEGKQGKPLSGRRPSSVFVHAAFRHVIHDGSVERAHVYTNRAVTICRSLAMCGTD